MKPYLMKRSRRGMPAMFACLVMTLSVHGADEPADETDVADLGQTTIQARRPAEERYLVDDASTGTRTDVPLSRTPISLQVVPHQVIDDQAAWRLTDAVRNVSGVHPEATPGFAVAFENAFIRGFSQRAYIDGNLTYGLPPIDLDGVQQVDVLKGPASVMYGPMEPGGMINTVPRKPRFEPHHEVYTQVGGYDFHRVGVDSTAPLDEEQTLAYRVTAAYQNSDSFRDTLNDESAFFAPSLSWNPTDDTRVTAWLWYQHLNRPHDDGVAFNAAGKPVVGIDHYIGDPDHNTQRMDDLFFNVKWEHDVSDQLTVRQQFMLHHTEGDLDTIRRFAATSGADTVQPFYDASEFKSNDFMLVTDAVWRFDTGPMKHTVLFGVDLHHFDYTFDRTRDTTLAPVSIFSTTIIGPYNPVFIRRQDLRTRWAGGFAQDQIDLLDDTLHVLLSGRVDYVDQLVDFSGHMKSHDIGLSGRVGALYDLTEWMAPYFNVARSFNPVSASSVGAGNDTLDPETGLEYEAGFKFQFFEDRLSITTAAYQIDKEDVAVADPANPGFSINGGALRSRGFELDVAGEIAPGLRVIGNYAYTDTEVIDSDTLPEGARFRNIPLNSGSLWLTYNFQEGTALEGFGFGGGVFAASDKVGDNADSFSLDGYARVDLGVWYNHVFRTGESVKVQLNVYNIFDIEYYESSFQTSRVQPGTPVNWMGRISFTF